MNPSMLATLLCFSKKILGKFLAKTKNVSLEVCDKSEKPFPLMFSSIIVIEAIV